MASCEQIFAGWFHFVPPEIALGFSVDPKRDTPERLKAYMSAFGPNFVGLTGTDEEIEQMLLDWPHRRLVPSRETIAAMRRRYCRFREAHGYKPWKYYKGRERWTPLPREFARRG